ncbi:ATP-dependent RNA helicase like protein [Babesia gibsoni]|uniref:ATP-dependent RNA helicase like protein n=1 Tax=Babesia gibsoni TaxID=33632 RepID=A0AAD8UV66_BABGI|nr:ATP-dependent RNA helicase like protein [Babesia gibsoni]
MASVLLGYRQDIITAVEGHNVVAVSGYPGLYMASHIPFFLYKAGFTEYGPCKKNPPRICVAQFRDSEVRANAEACSVLIGNRSKVTFFVGTHTSFDPSADVLYTTEDCLMRKVIADPLLSEYGVVILTGVENRMLSTDILMALLKRILIKRSRLRVVLCFEGGNVKEVLNFFKNIKVSSAEGIQDPLDHDELSKPSLGNLKKLGKVAHIHVSKQKALYNVHYLSSPSPNYLDTAVSTVWNIFKHETKGNVLVFVPSKVEMEMLYENLVESARSFREQGTGMVNVIPLGDEERTAHSRKKNPYASMNIYICYDMKDYKFKMDHITYVVDCGYSRRMISDYVNTGAVESTVNATRDEMRQRASVIAGSGKCYRLMTEAHFKDNTMVMEYTQSEIKTNDLTNALIFIRSLGVSNFTEFEFITQPPIPAIEHALTTLYLLGAIDREGEVVYPLGNIMAELPYTPALSCFLYKSTELGCSEEALTICAMLQVQDKVLKKTNLNSTYQSDKLRAAMLGFTACEGDLLSYFNVYQLSRYYRDEDKQWLNRHMVSEGGIMLAERMRARLVALLKKYQLPLTTCGENADILMEAIFKSFFLNVACKEHLIKTIITSRQLDVEVKVNTKVVDDEGNAILTNELQPYLLVPSIDTNKTRRLYINSGSFLANEQPDWVVFNESMDIDGELFMKNVTAIKPEFLQKYASHYYGALKVQSYLSDY